MLKFPFLIYFQFFLYCCIPTIYAIQWTNEKRFFTEIYLSFYCWKGPTVCCYLRDRWRDIYLERGLLLPISSSGSQWVPTLAPPFKPVRDASNRLHVPNSTPILCSLSQSDCKILITWFPSGYTPVWIRLLCLLITTWQLVKARGVTRNEPKIHGICYIIVWDFVSLSLEISKLFFSSHFCFLVFIVYLNTFIAVSSCSK